MQSKKNPSPNINDMYYVPQKKGDDNNAAKPKDKPFTGVDDSQSQSVEDKKVLRINTAECVKSSQGWCLNKPFIVRGTVEPLEDKVDGTQIILKINSTYNGKEDILHSRIEANVDDDNSFEVKVEHLFYNDFFVKDDIKPGDATFEMFAIASSPRSENELEGLHVTLPQESAFQELKKGHFDETAVAKDSSKTKDGEGFLEEKPVTELQDYLIKMRFLTTQKKSDGDFGENTEKAVIAFQKSAKKYERKKRTEPDLFKTDKVTFDGEESGIVDKKTWDELEKWNKEDWVKPMVTLSKGDYDDEAVKLGIQKDRNSDNYFKEYPVKLLQKNLQEIGIDKNTVGEIDGNFLDKTKTAIELFQEAAAKGEFWKSESDHTVVVLDEKLSGYMKGVCDAATQEKVEEVKEKGLKVPKGTIKLDNKEKLKLVHAIGVLESGKDGYSAVNKDYEFEGKISVSYTKDSNKPRHVGLSFGIIQFTQESSLGAVVSKMHKKNRKRFEDVFGKDSDKLITVLSKKGAIEYNDETFKDSKGKMVTKKVGRAPSVHPVGGIDIWKSPWIERFIESGKESDFQECQDEVAIENYLDTILTFCKTNTIKSQKALALVYDRHVNSGTGGLKGIKKHVEENEKQDVNSKEFWVGYAQTFTGTYSWINNRMQKIINSTELLWEANYEF